MRVHPLVGSMQNRGGVGELGGWETLRARVQFEGVLDTSKKPEKGNLHLFKNLLLLNYNFQLNSQILSAHVQ